MLQQVRALKENTNFPCDRDFLVGEEDGKGTLPRHHAPGRGPPKPPPILEVLEHLRSEEHGLYLSGRGLPWNAQRSEVCKSRSLNAALLWGAPGGQRAGDS